MNKKKILILCTGNSCRSQMVHGFLRKMGGEKIEVYSAGVETHGLNSKAVLVMQEAGIDISFHTSNHFDEYKSIDFDYMITVCDHAKELCPYFPSNAKIIHHDFSDPAVTDGTNDQILDEFRRVRDGIQKYCAKFIKDQFEGG
ncbi:MAG: arsenate reductase ArsC [Bacteroidia bacterium]|nr:arsenate reductase ArsC [Bacteroidia bacterium]